MHAHACAQVEEGFFSTRVPLFRCVANWIVQFGLAGDPAMNAKFEGRGTIRDDKQWIPEGS